MDEARGHPFLYDMAGDVDQYADFITYRQRMNKSRAAYSIIHKHRMATNTQIGAYTDKIKDGTHTFTSSDNPTRKHQFPESGLAVHIGDTDEITFPSHSIEASGAEADGRAARLLISCWTSLSEALVSGDASAANYSSILVAQSPSVRALETMRDVIKEEYERFIEWYLGRDIEPTFSFPPLTVTDVTKEANANQILHSNKVKSTKTWQEELDLDINKEEDNFEEEQAAADIRNPFMNGDQNNGEPEETPDDNQEGPTGQATQTFSRVDSAGRDRSDRK